MANWAVYFFVAYVWVVGASLYKMFYPALCPSHALRTECIHPLLPPGALPRRESPRCAAA